jgi:hypothetical protein
VLSVGGPYALYFLYARFLKKKNHNMLALMLDPRYNNMCLVIIYLGYEAIATLVANWQII